MTTEARWPVLLCAVIAVVLTWWSASLTAAVWGGYDTLAVMALDDAFLTGTDAAVIDRRGAVWVLRDISAQELIASGAVVIFPARAKTCLALLQDASVL